MKAFLFVSLLFNVNSLQEDQDVTELWRSVIMKAVDMMEKSQSWLDESSKGKELENDLDKLSKIPGLKDVKQENVVVKVIEKSLENQKKTIKLIDDMIELVLKDYELDLPDCPDPKPEDEPQNPALAPYSPNRSDPASPFKNRVWVSKRWGELPEKVLDEIERAKSDLDKIPPEWRSKLKDYYQSLEGNKDEE